VKARGVKGVPREHHKVPRESQVSREHSKSESRQVSREHSKSES